MVVNQTRHLTLEPYMTTNPYADKTFYRLKDVTPEDINGLLWLHDKGSEDASDYAWNTLQEFGCNYSPFFLKKAQRLSYASKEAEERFQEYLPDLITMFNQCK